MFYDLVEPKGEELKSVIKNKGRASERHVETLLLTLWVSSHFLMVCQNCVQGVVEKVQRSSCLTVKKTPNFATRNWKHSEGGRTSPQ